MRGPLICTFQRAGSQVLEKGIFWALKLAEAFKDSYIHLKGPEKEVIMTSFPK